MMTFSMRVLPPGSFRCGRRGGHCYYELGSPFLSHTPSAGPGGQQSESEPHPHGVGSPKESVPPSTWTESGQTPALPKVSSSPDRAMPAWAVLLAHEVPVPAIEPDGPYGKGPSVGSGIVRGEGCRQSGFGLWDPFTIGCEVLHTDQSDRWRR
jgi:hypothetical protein